MPSEPPSSTSRLPDQRDLTVLQVIKLSSDHLQKHGSDSARLDAEVLLATALGLRRLDLYLQFDRQLTEPELSTYRALVARRAHGEPVAYLVGHKEFMALDFEVTPAVLVPNPDTEVLVQRAVALAREAARPFRVADIGTGSGCVAVALAHYAPEVEVWATDISAEALEVAARNVAKHGLNERVHLACGDLMEPLEGTFDLVCANLPYLPSTSMLPVEVIAQPRTALYAGQGGSELVTRLLATAPPRLKPGGRVLAELDPSILSAVLEAADRSFTGRRIHHDLGGHERVVEAWS
jgi:release factor glutamine methyltransferase